MAVIPPFGKLRQEDYSKLQVTCPTNYNSGRKQRATNFSPCLASLPPCVCACMCVYMCERVCLYCLGTIMYTF